MSHSESIPFQNKERKGHNKQYVQTIWSLLIDVIYLETHNGPSESSEVIK